MQIMWLHLLVLLFSTFVVSYEDKSKNLLVLLENFHIKETHSTFLNMLTNRGYNLTTKLADESSISLKYLGEYLYSGLIILAPSVSEFGGALNVKEITNFVDDGGNLVVVAGPNVGESIRELGSECGVEFDEENTIVIDHFNFDKKDDGLHSLITVPVNNLVKSNVITGGKVDTPLLYRGIGISADQTNPLLIDVLHGSKTSYSYNPDKTIVDYPNTVGTNTQLITALQARNNARALFIGSLDFLSNSFFESTVETESQKSVICGNQMLTDNLLRWVLGERGQLRHVYVKHHRVGETLPPSQYTILDDVIYIIKIETKDDNGNWVPFNADDVQLEFVRIDPFIRKKMEHKNGEYKLVMKLPDVYGVFKFVVDYYRVGYTHLLSVTQVPVRPFTHTQYERFLVAAYPYYGSAISMMIGLILFSFIFLYLKDDKEKGE
ncbi:hypothetical protein MS3_00005464 [Schistosoma haematobium]|uniref:Dolichyl-diphosphooligosaccharide--protein glycosyltransferase 48 kDa subunit n=2 Tax=Schistosoma haematobium TaxID=6185 RepID=A0A6A5DKZ3_SCHHA|nr:hypothetical protein MS3_00005464 [Schistosoma haematobium]KAH9594340.1 hypothetical protein MS3_00005464 [Schistosoma haematobium]CAH8442627.1 unnamed protein product [Schistosoma haematobium]CAH8442833.1 unnamed protein product [Schistosoma haematobium]